MANIPGLSAIRAAGKALAEGEGGLTATADEAERFLLTLGRSAGAAFAAGEGEAGIVAAETAGEAAASFTLWGVLVILLALVFTLRLVEHFLKQITSHIPAIMGGWAVQKLVDWEFGILDKVEDAILDRIITATKSVLHDLQLLVFYLLGVDPVALSRLLSGSGASGNNVATQGQIKVLQAEIDWLNKRLATVAGQVQAPSPAPSPVPAPAPSPVPVPGTTTIVQVPPALWQQVHNLEREYSLIRSDLTDFDTRLRTATHTITSVEHQVQTLISQVHDVRAVAVGWQEIAHQVDQLGTQLTHFVNVTQADLSEIHHHQAQMAPLGLLLQPGINGLKNLRKLEDNPCGCPKLPGIPRLQPELLAEYEFLTHG